MSKLFVAVRGRSVALLLSCCGLLMLVACTSPESRRSPAAPAGVERSAADDPLQWWHVRFRFSRSAADETDSYLDGLVAVEVVAPVLDEIETDIRFWRFHRRWPDDSVGHQFSFLFYGTHELADIVDRRLRDVALLRQLREQGYLRDWFVEASSASEATVVASTSDHRWPPQLQQTWPHFIMGASRMWLGLLRDAADRRADETMHPRYRAVETDLETLWYREANHALFHHLSALFGYRPLRVRGHGAMRF